MISSAHRFERMAAVVGVEADDDDALTEIRELGADVYDFVAQELRFVDANHFRARGQFVQDFGGLGDVVGGNAQTGVRNDFVGGVALVNGGLEDLDALTRNLRAAQAADQFLALAGKHGSDDDFDPTHVAFDDVHGRSCLKVLRYKFSVVVRSKCAEFDVNSFLVKIRSAHRKNRLRLFVARSGLMALSI